MERLRDLVGHLRDAADHAEERIESVLEEHGFGKIDSAPPMIDSGRPEDLLGHDTALMAESVAMVEQTLVQAAAARASDIHLENEVDEVRIRVRIDGDLRPYRRLDIDKTQLQRMVRVIKVKAGIDIADTRTAQGGQFETLIGGQAWYVRVQTQPTIRGENLIMRLLSQDTGLQSIGELGFLPEAEARYRRLLRNPGGLVLVVGPTGSGKTTTLYAGLRELADDECRKVISIEDPVEYRCAGVQQVEISREVGFGFADAMRAFVRQDPDVILLGEIRDPESALEAIRASQTGHLVLSTLHCNDSVDAVQRLLDLGMLPNSISSELLAVFAQRLAKRICRHCRERAEPDPEVASEIFPYGVPEGYEVWRGRGCAHCDHTGSFGRIAVVEHLPMNGRLRNAIANGRTLEGLREVARESGLVPLREIALELARSGVIAFDTLPRFIPIDRLIPTPT